MEAEAAAATEAPLRSPVDTTVETVPVETAIDLAHLARMTLGEARLEAEVLMLFDRQVEILLAHLQDATPAAAAAFAHTLKGSARGVGAWSVAAAAEAVEVSATASAVARLAAAVAAVKAEIADRLYQHRQRKE